MVGIKQAGINLVCAVCPFLQGFWRVLGGCRKVTPGTCRTSKATERGPMVRAEGEE